MNNLNVKSLRPGMTTMNHLIVSVVYNPSFLSYEPTYSVTVTRFWFHNGLVSSMTVAPDSIYPYIITDLD
jgi:hypothetical protein